MPLNNRTRLHKLCSRALAETDPQEFAALLSEIDDILSETFDDLVMMLNDVEHVLRRRERLSRIHLT
jgi:hypothetical protein